MCAISRRGARGEPRRWRSRHFAIEEAQSIWRQLGLAKEIPPWAAPPRLGAFLRGRPSHRPPVHGAETQAPEEARPTPFLVNRAQLGLLQILIGLSDVRPSGGSRPRRSSWRGGSGTCRRRVGRTTSRRLCALEERLRRRRRGNTDGASTPRDAPGPVGVPTSYKGWRWPRPGARMRAEPPQRMGCSRGSPAGARRGTGSVLDSARRPLPRQGARRSRLGARTRPGTRSCTMGFNRAIRRGNQARRQPVDAKQRGLPATPFPRYLAGA